MADAAIQFCEKCGRDRETFPTGREVIRVCPVCASACCPDCWNLVSGACLACVPFSLPTAAPRRIVIAAEAIAPAAATDAKSGSRARPAKASRAASGLERATPAPTRRAREPRSTRSPGSTDPPAASDAAASHPTPGATEPLPGDRSGKSRQALRFVVGVAASGIIVVGVSFATVAATWRHTPAVAVEQPSPTATASAAAIEPTAAPTASPARRTPAPATARPAGPRPTDRRTTTPSKTPASKTPTPPPIILPPATPKPTPVPTPPPTPEPTAASDTPAP